MDLHCPCRPSAETIATESSQRSIVYGHIHHGAILRYCFSGAFVMLLPYQSLVDAGGTSHLAAVEHDTLNDLSTDMLYSAYPSTA